MFLDCGKIFSEFMPFIIHQRIYVEDVLMLAALTVVESLASNKVAMQTEARFPQSIHNLSLSHSDTLSLLSSRWSIRCLIKHELIL